MNKRVFLLGRSARGTAPQTGTLEHSPEQDLSRRNGVDNQNTSICNNMMHEHGIKM